MIFGIRSRIKIWFGLEFCPRGTFRYPFAFFFSLVRHYLLMVDISERELCAQRSEEYFASESDTTEVMTTKYSDILVSFLHISLQLFRTHLEVAKLLFWSIPKLCQAGEVNYTGKSFRFIAAPYLNKSYLGPVGCLLARSGRISDRCCLS